jgi:hypothetical protein
MRLSHIRLTIGLAAFVAATALATVGPAAARAPGDDAGQHGARAAAVGHSRGRYQLKLGQAGRLLAAAPAAGRGFEI